MKKNEVKIGMRFLVTEDKTPKAWAFTKKQHSVPDHLMFTQYSVSIKEGEYLEIKDMNKGDGGSLNVVYIDGNNNEYWSFWSDFKKATRLV